MTEQTPPAQKGKRHRTAPLSSTQDPSRKASRADKPDPCRSAAAAKAPKPNSQTRAQSQAPGASRADKARPVDPMALMMPFMKSSVALATATVHNQIKMYDFFMQATPIGAMARQQAQINKMMTQAMVQMTPFGIWGGKK